MNIALHSAYGLLELLAAVFVGGIVSAFIFLLIRQIYFIPSVAKSSRFIRYGEFLAYMQTAKPRKVLISVSDYLTCVILTVLLLCMTFVYNSGRFRVLSILFILIGFILGTKIFSRPMFRLMIFALFCLKWLTDILLFPIAWLLKTLKRIVAKLLGKLYALCSTIFEKKYTSYKFSRIKKEARYGLLDDYYKEKIK